MLDANRAARFWARVDRSGGAEACWPWVGPRTLDGYGHLRIEGAEEGSHRVAYELLVGPIPDGLEIDHLCANRVCTNPAHMEPVTKATNLRRMHERQGHKVNWNREALARSRARRGLPA